MAAARTNTPPVIDGRLDDAVWQKAPASEAFTQKFPHEGASPSDRTTVRVLNDDQAIYIGIDCEQGHAPVVQHLPRRDRLVESDRVEVDLGTRRDHKSAFQFTVNAGGVLTDAVLFNDTDSSSDWDENWDASVARTPQGWSGGDDDPAAHPALLGVARAVVGPAGAPLRVGPPGSGRVVGEPRAGSGRDPAQAELLLGRLGSRDVSPQSCP
jgi:hypothetical protein